MKSGRVVERFDVLEYLLSHRVTGRISVTVDSFDFQGVAEGLGTGIVEAVAFGTHRTDEPVFS